MKGVGNITCVRVTYMGDVTYVGYCCSLFLETKQLFTFVTDNSDNIFWPVRVTHRD